eukprot:4006710-Prymnesium_polylepis.1
MRRCACRCCAPRALRAEGARRLLAVQPVAEPISDLVGRHVLVAALLPHVVNGVLAVHEQLLDQRRRSAISRCSATPSRALRVDFIEPLPQCRPGTLRTPPRPIRTGEGISGERLRAPHAGQCVSGL